MSEEDNDLPMLSMKKAIMPVLVIGGPIVLAALVFLIPLIVSEFKSKDNDAAVALIVQLIGLVILFVGLIVFKINSIKRKRLEFELHSYEPVNKLDTL